MADAIYDFNKDGCVDHEDLEFIRATIGKRKGDEGYDERCDYDQDGVISITDFNIFRQHLGEGCGEPMPKPEPPPEPGPLPQPGPSPQPPPI